ncbi:hypothetical protein CCX46_20350 [Pseudomonas sp. RU47]|nr:hypothetical protein CCX46_20350 [Pseudomonas sp. RU47]QHF51910.1 hypothetical protein PspS49_20530 [Pseudomonas sp. S49]
MSPIAGYSVICGVTPHPLWERACSRRRRISQHHCWIGLRFREQARSHRVLCCVSAIWAS